MIGAFFIAPAVKSVLHQFPRVFFSSWGSNLSASKSKSATRADHATLLYSPFIPFVRTLTGRFPCGADVVVRIAGDAGYGGETDVGDADQNRYVHRSALWDVCDHAGYAAQHGAAVQCARGRHGYFPRCVARAG